jgi:hypothetical protein
MTDPLIKSLEMLAKSSGKSFETVKAEFEEQRKQSEIEQTTTTIRGQKVALGMSTNNAQLSLPLWGEKVRGVPNSVLRSALFTATKRGKRPYLEKVSLASVDGIEVMFTGPRLDQADLDVWEQCLHIARHEKLGSLIHFQAGGFLKAIGRSTGKSDYEWLNTVLRRLMTSMIELKEKDRVYAGQLLQRWARDEHTGQHLIELNRDLSLLYNDDRWTGVDWEQRKRLKGKPLALWLHGFYSTHARPFDYRVDTLHKLCGSEAAELKSFKQNLKEALLDLSAATDWQCVLINDKTLIQKPKPDKKSS